MNWRDDLAEEMGYTICPICFPEYVYCDNDCENCYYNKEFKEGLEGLNNDRKRSKRNTI